MSDKNDKRKKRRFLFLFVTAANEAQFKYDGTFDVPEELRKKWAIEIEESKKDLLIKRTRNRASFSYWLQWLFPLVCVICAALEPERLTELLLLGFGGSFGTNVSRKISKHAYLSRAVNIIRTATNKPRFQPKPPPIEPEVLTPEDDEEDDGAVTPSADTFLG